MYKVIMFDFFGVFCNSIGTTWFKQHVPDAETKLDIVQELSTQNDLGKMSRAEFAAILADLAGVSAVEAEAGIEALVTINTDLVAYTKELKAKGYRIACLSNGSHEWTLKIIVDQGLRDLFEEVVLSADLGIIKPDPRIYLQTLDKLGVSADQAVFVDDRKVNTDAAEACGIRSLVFTDTPTFIEQFENLTL